MNSNARIYHVRGFTLKFKQALRGIEECAFGWVEEGKIIRDLTLAESIAARNQQSKLREALPLSELPNLRYEAPESQRNSEFWDQRAELLRQSGQFVRATTYLTHKASGEDTVCSPHSTLALRQVESTALADWTATSCPKNDRRQFCLESALTSLAISLRSPSGLL